MDQNQNKYIHSPIEISIPTNYLKMNFDMDIIDINKTYIKHELNITENLRTDYELFIDNKNRNPSKFVIKSTIENIIEQLKNKLKTTNATHEEIPNFKDIKCLEYCKQEKERNDILNLDLDLLLSKLNY